MKKNIPILFILLVQVFSLAAAKTIDGTESICESTDAISSEDDVSTNEPSKKNSKGTFTGFLDDDGVADVLETRTVYWFTENDGCEVLEFSVAVKIKLMNEDGSVKKEHSFVDDYSFCDDEIDGCIGYSIKDNLILRTFIRGAHSYRIYETFLYQYESEIDNWVLKNAHAEINPLHENQIKNKVLNDEKICLYDKELGKFLDEFYF